MKIIRTLSGVKRIEDSDANILLLKVRQILDEQRNGLITRLITDLGSYIDYKFRVRPDAHQLEAIKDKLYSLKNSGLDLEKYNAVLQHVLDHDTTYINAEPFYREIDENISWHLNAAQLKLVK
ncbi:MAG TPA: hypothetical protein VGD40_24425 [Chryseosolibacter sp.]